MCGIIGYIGHQKASPILINGLLRLEYRGYDSAGISTIEKNGLSVMKDKGRVKNLYNLDGIDSLEGTIGIAHTRWATHGKPSKENAHPHLDNSNSFAVVHNGIIENYNDLKKLLKGCNSRYSLVVGTAKRAREIREEAIEREEPIDVKTVSLAIDEILEGKYVIEEPDELKSDNK